MAKLKAPDPPANRCSTGIKSSKGSECSAAEYPKPRPSSRERAKRVLADFYRGIDPRSQRRGQMTLEGALDLYLQSRANHPRPRSAQAYREVVTRHLDDWLERPLREITRDMVETKLTEIAAAVASEGRYSGNATANGAMRSLRSCTTLPPTAPTPTTRCRLTRFAFAGSGSGSSRGRDGWLTAICQRSMPR